MANAAAVNEDRSVHRFAKDQLKAFVERVERLEEEKKAIADDIRDVYAEAKVNGYDIKALRVSDPAPQAGHQRAQGAGSDFGNLPARAGNAGLRDAAAAWSAAQSPTVAITAATRCGSDTSPWRRTRRRCR